MTAQGGGEPRLAATLVLVRPQVGGKVPYEVCMIRRAPGMRVLPGYMAFPGGVVEDKDFATASAWLSVAARPAPSTGVLAGGRTGGPGPSAFSAPEAFATPTTGTAAGVAREPLYAALLCAAVRELQEEVGLVLSSAPEGVQEGPSAVAGLASEAGVSGALGGSRAGLLAAVRYIGRRVTPAALPARFDAHFFVARAAAPDAPFTLAATEVESAFWLSPDAVLADSTFLLAPPTRDVLQLLSAFPDLEQLFASGFLPEQRSL